MIDVKKLKVLTKKFNVLYVEDEEQMRESLMAYLVKIFKNVKTAKDGQEGLELYRHEKFDIVITDIQMPNLNGIEMAKKIKELNHKQEIMIVSAYTEINYFIESIKIGISGYIIKPVDFSQMNEEIYKIVYKLKKFNENKLYGLHLEELIEERTKEKESLQAQIIENHQQTLFALVGMIEKRDSYTGGHSQRVAKYSMLIAKELGCAYEECEKLYQAGILHDIGKISTPDSILLKPGKLSDIEYKLIQEHVESGYDMLKKIYMYKELAKIIRCHHERYDGTGYPKGLKGDEIPFLSRIMMVADAFDAMTTNRIYKKRKSIDEALKEIKELSKIQFHPEIADVSFEALNKISIEKNISQLPKNELEKERFSYFYKDQTVNTYNKSYFELILNKDCQEKKYKYLKAFYFHGLTKFNEKYSWNEGDEILAKFVSILEKISSKALIFRVHGEAFAVLLEENIQLKDDFFKDIDFLKNSDIRISKKNINLLEKKICSFEDLEKCIHFY